MYIPTYPTTLVLSTNHHHIPPLFKKETLNHVILMSLAHYIQFKGSFITFYFLILILNFKFFLGLIQKGSFKELLERIVVVLSVAGFLQQLQASSVCGHVECQTFLAVLNKLSKLDK